MKKYFSQVLWFCFITYNVIASDLRQTVQEFSEILSSQKSIDLKLLKDCPEVISTLGQWTYEEWHPYDKSLTLERATNGFNKYLNDTAVPFAIVAFQENRPIGVISLKANGGKEFADLPGLWGGIFHVIPEARNKGLGKALGHLLMSMARQLGYNNIYFYTSNPSNVPMYVKQGAEILETRPFRGHTVTVMKMHLNSTSEKSK